MNFKKFISGMSALAVASSVFAGLAVTASAEKTQQTTHSTTGAVSWDINGGANKDLTWPTISGGTETVNSHYQGGGDNNGDRGAVLYYATTLVPDSLNQTVTVDFTLGMSAANSNSTHLYLMGSNNRKGNAAPSGNIILDFELTPSSKELKVNGTNIKPDVTIKAGNIVGEGNDYGNTALTPMSASMDFLTHTVDLTITKAEGKTATYENIPMTDNTVTGFRGFYSLGGKKFGANAVKDVTTYLVDRETPVQTVKYTVKFVNESGTKIKTPDIVRVSAVGTEVTAIADDLKDIEYGGQNYIYKEGNKTITLTDQESDNVITLVFRLPNTYHANIAAQYGDDSTEKLVDNQEITEHEAFSCPYKKYVVKDGVLYEGPQNSFSQNSYYNYKVDSVIGDINITLNYTAKEDKAIYYKEAEEISGFTPGKAGNENIRCSNAAGGDISEKTEITELKPGTYKLSTAVWGGSNSDDAQNSTYTFTKEDGTVILTAKTNGSYSPMTSEEFTLDTATKIYIEKKAGSKNTCIDYVLITGTEQAVVVPTTNTAFTFNSDVNSVLGKTVKVTVNDESKTGILPSELSTEVTGKGDLLLAIVIKNVPVDATVSAVIVD